MRLLRHRIAIAAALACLASAASARIDLIAVGQLSGSLSDLSGLSAPLENGQPGDVLGGIGSGLAWAGGSTFLALPDRGPNAVAWNDALDDTTSYVPRFHTLTLALQPAASGSLPFMLAPTLEATTLTYAAKPLAYGPAVPTTNTDGKHYFSGRSDNFDPAASSLDRNDARFDPEGIRVSNNGRRVYVSDEYGPFIHEFDRASGRRLRSIPLPSMFGVANVAPTGDAEIAGNTSGRVANKGMEGLAITPDGGTLVGFVQSPLIQDGGDGGRANRIVTIDLASGAVGQYAYDNYIPALAKAYNSSEILAINSHELLVLERDGKGLGDGSTAAVKQIWKVDLKGAEDVSGLAGEAVLLAKAPAKTLFLDLRAALNAAGITDDRIPAKLEGMAFGEDVALNGAVRHTLYVANDNDFIATTDAGLDNPNQWFVFAFDDEDLAGSAYRPQRPQEIEPTR